MPTFFNHAGKVLLGFIAILLLIFLTGAAVSPPLIVLLGAIGGAISYFTINAITKSKESKRQSAGDSADEAEPKEEVPTYVRYAEALVDLQGELRLDPHRDDSVVTKAEAIITKLIDVLEKVNSDVELSKISFAVEINMIAEDYLPNRVLRQSYLRVFPEDRPEHRQEVMEMLTTLEGELDTALDNIRNRRLSDLDHQARFFKKKFEESREINA